MRSDFVPLTQEENDILCQAVPGFKGNGLYNILLEDLIECWVRVDFNRELKQKLEGNIPISANAQKAPEQGNA